MEQGRPVMEESDSDEEMIGFDPENIRRPESRSTSSSENELYCLYDSDGGDTYDNAYTTYSSNLESDVGYDDDDDGVYLESRVWGPPNERLYEAEILEEELEDTPETEEVEARRIQRRIASELNESDFVVALRAGERQAAESRKPERVMREVASLTSRDKLDLMQKESPEFFVLVQDLKSKLHEIDNVLIPILNYFGNAKDMPAPVKFLKKKFLVLTNYCTNITFYLLLKAKKSPIGNHPVIKSLFKYRRVMEEIQELDEAMKPKVEKVLMELKQNNNPALEKLVSALKEKNFQGWVQKSKEEMLRKEAEANAAASSAGTYMECVPGTSMESVPGTSGIQLRKGSGFGKGVTKSGKPDKGKRAITYQMAKNKGLIPRRNKLQRNPRVKHRNKYRKALIKRRGQMRFPRTEIPAYGGEPSGIKSNVTKSIKFK